MPLICRAVCISFHDMAFDSEDCTSHHPACRALAIKWRMPVELALDLVALALYDIVIYADDSTSMKYAESGARIDDMKVILERVTEVATLFDHDGMLIIVSDCLAYIPAFDCLACAPVFDCLACTPAFDCLACTPARILQQTPLLYSNLSLGLCWQPSC